MKRRAFITLLGGAATWPLAARAQRPGSRVYRIGILGATSLRAAEGFLNAFPDGMRERGYVEGQNLVIEYRAPTAASEQNRDVATDLVRGGYDVPSVSVAFDIDLDLDLDRDRLRHRYRAPHLFPGAIEEARGVGGF